MNDSTGWDDRRNEQDEQQRRLRERNQQGSGSQGSHYGSNFGQQTQQDWDRQNQGRNRQDWQQQGFQSSRPGQQDAWHDEDQRRSGSYRGTEWRGERDWGTPRYDAPGFDSGSSYQPNRANQQNRDSENEWRTSGAGNTASRYGGGFSDEGGDYRYAERAWGGSSGRGPTAQAAEGRSGPQRYRDQSDRSQGYSASSGGGAAGYGYSSQDSDVGARRGQDWYSQDTGRPGSQSFAAGYGMGSGANYDEWAGSGQRYGHSGGSNPTFGRGYGPDYGRDEGRGFFERAGDEIASWFGDEDAARRREQDYRGHGPSDYQRSDERIREDVNDRLTDDPRVDARRISTAVKDGEVTLSGMVSSREAKRRAEDCVDRISGVKHVQNNLRVEDRAATGTQAGSQAGTQSEWSSPASSGAAGAASGHSATSGSAASAGTSAGSTAGSATGSTAGGSSGLTGSSATSPTAGSSAGSTTGNAGSGTKQT